MIAAKLPWWLGIVLAGLSYAGLHWYAGTPVTTTADPTKMFDVVGPTMWRTLAMFGQYVVPAVLVLGACVSAWRSRTRFNLAASVTEDPTASTLNRMHWREFELVVGEAFRQRGYKVTERGGGGPDGGVDLVIRKGSEATVVQCKQYRATKVNVAVVRDLFGAMTAEGASAGMVVTLGSFTRDAEAFARGRNIELVTGKALRALLREGSTVQGVRSAARASSVEALQYTAPDRAQSVPGETPTCPRCSAPMTKRVAKAGSNAGKPFWGCSKFPECRGTRDIAG